MWMTRHKWNEIVKMDIQGVGCESVKRFIWAMIAISGGLLLT
jgi:hypothetical protein